MTHQNRTKYLTVYVCWTEICLPSLNYIMRLRFINITTVYKSFVRGEHVSRLTFLSVDIFNSYTNYKNWFIASERTHFHIWLYHNYSSIFLWMAHFSQNIYIALRRQSSHNCTCIVLQMVLIRPCRFVTLNVTPGNNRNNKSVKSRITQLIFRLWLNNFFHIICFVVFSHLEFFGLNIPENFILISNCVHLKVFPLIQFLFFFAYFHWIQMQSISNYLSSSVALRSLYLFRNMCNFAWTKWILHGSALRNCIVERLESFCQWDNFLIGKKRRLWIFFRRNAFASAVCQSSYVFRNRK